MIANAADRQMLLLRTFQTGKNADLSQRLLNEVAAAKVCLLNAEKKLRYDAALKRKLASADRQEKARPPEMEPAAVVPDIRIQAGPSEHVRLARAGKRGVGRLVAAGGGVAGAVLVVILAIVLTRGGDETALAPPTPDPDSPVVPQVQPPDTTSVRASGNVTAPHEKEEFAPTRPPKLAAVADQMVQADKELRLFVSVEDPGEPSREGSFRLLSTPPDGMVIDPHSGELAWQPASNMPAGTHRVGVGWVGADGTGFAETWFLVRVEPKPSRPPRLAAVARQTVRLGEKLDLPVTVDDPGEPAGHLDFRLTEQIAGVRIDASTGKVTIAPGDSAAPGLYDVGVLVTSDAPGRPTATTSFQVEVLPAAEVRSPVPDEAARSAALAKVRELFKVDARQVQARLALAAHLIRLSDDAKDDPAEQYVMLEEAKSLAEQAGGVALAMAAVERLGRHFDLEDPVGLEIDALKTSLRKVQGLDMDLVVASIGSLCEAAPASGHADDVKALCRQARVTAQKVGGPQIAAAIDRQENLLDERERVFDSGRDAEAKLAATRGDAQASLDAGLRFCLLDGDWDKGLPLLAVSGKPPLAETAGKLASNQDDVPGQLAFADALSEAASTSPAASGTPLLLEAAAEHWYRRALPRLAGDDLARVKMRLAEASGAVATAKPAPFALALNGLGGLAQIVPEKVDGKAAPTGGFATLAGDATIEYPSVPACAYIQELEITFLKPGGWIKFRYGDPSQGVWLLIKWNGESKKYNAQVQRYLGNHWWWYGRGRDFDPQKPIRLTVACYADRHDALEDGTRLVSRVGDAPTDLALQIIARDNPAAVISRCRFRPWRQSDARAWRCTMPSPRVECPVLETAVAYHDLSFGLEERPDPRSPGPFLVGSTGAPMVWVPAGSFRHPHSKQEGETEVVLSHGYWVGRCEVTQGQWATLARSNPARTIGSPYLPVDGVSWEEAANYCKELTRREQQARRLPKDYVYRLPTEAEWEMACRAGAEGDYPVPVGKFWNASSSDARPHEVATSEPNAWGLFDMQGNVGEWCADAWQDEPEQPVWRLVDPWVPPKSSGDYLLIRGGGWWAENDSCTATARRRKKSVPGGYQGFRIVLAPPLTAGQ